jgi:hypothetical protein
MTRMERMHEQELLGVRHDGPDAAHTLKQCRCRCPSIRPIRFM